MELICNHCNQEFDANHSVISDGTYQWCSNNYTKKIISFPPELKFN